MSVARFSWRGVREAEGARLESACAVTPYRGFESHPLRLITLPAAAPISGCRQPLDRDAAQPRRHRGKTLQITVWSALLAALLLLAFGASPLVARGPERVDEVFAAWDSTRSPGVALGVIHHGVLVYASDYGMANLKHGVPISATKVFRIGSTSKQFTAACIAILAIENKISLEDDIREYLPEMPEYPRLVTVEHLVHPTSGLRDYLTLEFGVRGRRGDDFYTPEDSLELLTQQREPNFLPGDEHLYSNSGYLLLGMIVERVTAQTLAEFAQERILRPLGMSNTHFHDDHTLPVRNRADGYASSEDGFRIANTTLDHVGDEGVLTTVEDLLSWDRAFYSDFFGAELTRLMH